MFRSIATLLVLATTALLGCSAPHPPGQSPDGPPIPVKLASAHEEPLDALYRASVRGRTTAVLTSKTVGHVRSVAVRAGDRVQVGQVLAMLEANESSASVRRANAGFDQSLEARAEAEKRIAVALQKAIEGAEAELARRALVDSTRKKKHPRARAYVDPGAKQAKKDAAARLAAERAQEKARLAEEARLNLERAELEKTLQGLTSG